MAATRVQFQMHWTLAEVFLILHSYFTHQHKACTNYEQLQQQHVKLLYFAHFFYRKKKQTKTKINHELHAGQINEKENRCNQYKLYCSLNLVNGVALYVICA